MYAANHSFPKLVAQGAAENNLAGVFLVKPLTDTKGYYLLLPIYCSGLSYCSSAFPSLQTAPDLVLVVLLSVKGSLLCCWKLPLSAARGVPEQCKWGFPARILNFHWPRRAAIGINFLTVVNKLMKSYRQWEKLLGDSYIR